MAIPSFALSAVASLVAGTVSSNVLLPTVGSPTTALITNMGESLVYLLLGSSEVVASAATGVALLPGASLALTIGSASNLAAISDQSVPLNVAVGS
jgi:hypothetical protein